MPETDARAGLATEDPRQFYISQPSGGPSFGYGLVALRKWPRKVIPGLRPQLLGDGRGHHCVRIAQRRLASHGSETSYCSCETCALPRERPDRGGSGWPCWLRTGPSSWRSVKWGPDLKLLSDRNPVGLCRGFVGICRGTLRVPDCGGV